MNNNATIIKHFLLTLQKLSSTREIENKFSFHSFA